MSGNIEGGKKCAATNKERYGSDWYRKIGAMGGRKATTKPKGFAANRELARTAGRIGGLKSKRGIHMPDELWQLKQKLYYCKSRVSFYENKLTEDKKLKTDFQIQQAEYGLEHWKNNMVQIEEKIKLMEDQNE